MSNTVRTFNASGKCMSIQHFENAAKAYTEYKNIIDNLTKTLPSGYYVTVVRYHNDNVMSMETISK